MEHTFIEPRAPSPELFFAQMGDFSRMLLPVAAVEWLYGDFLRLGIQAAHIDIVAVRVGPGDIEWLDAAGPAKGMFGHTGIPGVSGDIFPPAD